MGAWQVEEGGGGGGEGELCVLTLLLQHFSLLWCYYVLFIPCTVSISGCQWLHSSS